MLALTPAAVKGLLQRARSSLRRRPATETDHSARGGSPAEVRLARRFAQAYSADDVAGVVALLTDDAWLAMPPAPHEYHGVDAVASFLRASGEGRAGLRLMLTPTRANGQTAFSCSLEATDGAKAQPSGVIVLTVSGDRLEGITRFLDPRLPSVFSSADDRSLESCTDDLLHRSVTSRSEHKTWPTFAGPTRGSVAGAAWIRR